MAREPPRTNKDYHNICTSYRKGVNGDCVRTSLGTMVPPIYWNLTSQLGSEVYKEPDVRSAGVTAININGATLQLLAIPPIATSHSTPITRLNNYIISANYTLQRQHQQPILCHTHNFSREQRTGGGTHNQQQS